jgi:hypothetical protein
MDRPADLDLPIIKRVDHQERKRDLLARNLGASPGVGAIALRLLLAAAQRARSRRVSQMPDQPDRYPRARSPTH